MRQCYSGALTKIIMQCVISNTETKRITMEKPPSDKQSHEKIKQTHTNTNLFSASFILFSSRVGFSWKALQGEMLAPHPPGTQMYPTKPTQPQLGPKTASNQWQTPWPAKNTAWKLSLHSLTVFFPDSLMPTPKAEEEAEAVRSSQWLQAFRACLQQGHPHPHLPRVLPAIHNSRGKKKKTPIFTLRENPRATEMCNLSREWGSQLPWTGCAAGQKSCSVPHGHDGEHGIKFSQNCGLWLHPNLCSC